MSRIVTIVNGSDNLASVVLMSGGAALGMSGVTRVQIHVDDADSTVIDSDVISMSWGTMIDGEYPIQFKGDDAGLTAGVYRDCAVRIFDSTSTDGLVWVDPLTLVVE